MNSQPLLLYVIKQESLDQEVATKRFT